MRIQREYGEEIKVIMLTEPGVPEKRFTLVWMAPHYAVAKYDVATGLWTCGTCKDGVTASESARLSLRKALELFPSAKLAEEAVFRELNLDPKAVPPRTLAFQKKYKDGGWRLGSYS